MVINEFRPRLLKSNALSTSCASIGESSTSSKYSCNISKRSIDAGIRIRVPKITSVSGVDVNLSRVDRRMSKCDGAPVENI